MDSDWYSFDNEIDKQQIEGNSWNVDVIAGSIGNPDTQHGYGRQIIRVPASYQGLTGVFEIGYAHAYLPSNIIVNIAYKLISFGSSTPRKEYSTRYNFTH